MKLKVISGYTNHEGEDKVFGYREFLKPRSVDGFTGFQAVMGLAVSDSSQVRWLPPMVPMEGLLAVPSEAMLDRAIKGNLPSVSVFSIEELLKVRSWYKGRWTSVICHVKWLVSTEGTLSYTASQLVPIESLSSVDEFTLTPRPLPMDGLDTEIFERFLKAVTDRRSFISNRLKG